MIIIESKAAAHHIRQDHNKTIETLNNNIINEEILIKDINNNRVGRIENLEKKLFIICSKANKINFISNILESLTNLQITTKKTSTIGLKLQIQGLLIFKIK